MREPTFLILTALAGGTLHGYGIIREISELSRGDVVLGAGTLYGALDRLVEQELIAVERDEAVDGRLRRYYRLTPAGSAALTTEAERLQRNAEAAVSRLRRPRPGTGPALGGLPA